MAEIRPLLSTMLIVNSLTEHTHIVRPRDRTLPLVIVALVRDSRAAIAIAGLRADPEIPSGVFGLLLPNYTAVSQGFMFLFLGQTPEDGHTSV